MPKKVCSAAMRRSAPTMRACLAMWMPRRRGTSANSAGRKAGMASAATTSSTAASAEGMGSSHARPSVASSAGACSERRRLSSILPSPTEPTAWLTLACRRIHGSSCQSPRVQRCWRLAATS